MLSSIDIHSSVAVYVQIENHIQFAIASGKLKATDQLPSVKELSERLGVNPNTVAKAYRDLEVMGLIHSRRGIGVFIRKGVEAKCREDCRRRIIARLHEVVSEAKMASISKEDVSRVVEKSMAMEANPYVKVPSSILDWGRKKPGGQKTKPTRPGGRGPKPPRRKG